MGGARCGRVGWGKAGRVVLDRVGWGRMRRDRPCSWTSCSHFRFLPCSRKRDGRGPGVALLAGEPGLGAAHPRPDPQPQLQLPALLAVEPRLPQGARCLGDRGTLRTRTERAQCVERDAVVTCRVKFVARMRCEPIRYGVRGVKPSHCVYPTV